MSYKLFVCIVFSLAFSAKATKVTPRADNACVGKPDGTLLPHAEDCRKFYNCNSNIAFVGDCPENLYFNPLTTRCDYQENVECHAELPPAEEEDVDCPAEGLAMIASKIQCDWYYICMQGTPSLMVCADGTHFSEVTARCESEEIANCQIGISSTTETSSTTEISSTTEPPSTGLDKYCKPDTLHSIPHPFNCNLFILCFNGTAITRNCTEGLHYSAKDEVCMKPREASCIADGTICPKINDPTDIVVVENIYDCASFYMCFNGSPVPIQCGPNQHWNQKVAKCVLKTNSACKALDYPFDDLNVAFATCQPTGTYFVPQSGKETTFLMCDNGIASVADYSPVK